MTTEYTDDELDSFLDQEVHFANLDGRFEQANKLYAIAQRLREMQLVDVKDKLPPVFSETGQSFLAIWMDEDEIDSVEWYTFDGEDYWNQNSGNLNKFGGVGNIQMFDYWMLLDALPQPKDES